MSDANAGPPIATTGADTASQERRRPGPRKRTFPPAPIASTSLCTSLTFW